MSSGFAVMATAGAAHADAEKWFVCKYVAKPHSNEFLHHVISVPDAAISGPGWFGDSHTSYVIGPDTGQATPPLSSCPGPGQTPCPEGQVLEGDQCVTPPERCPAGTARAGEVVGDQPCDSEQQQPVLCGEGTDHPALLADGSEGPCNDPEPVLCGEGTDHPALLADGSQGPCNDPEPVLCPAGTDRQGEVVGDVSCDGEAQPPVEVCPDGTERAGQPVGTQPCSEQVIPPLVVVDDNGMVLPPSAGGAKEHTGKHATRATSATSAPASTTVTPTAVHAGLGDVPDLAASQTARGLALVLTGALVLLAAGLGVVRRSGELVRVQA